MSSSYVLPLAASGFATPYRPFSRLIKSAAGCRACCWSNVRQCQRRLSSANRRSRAARFSQRILSIWDRLDASELLAFGVQALWRRRKNVTTNPPADKGREAATTDAPTYPIDHLVERGKALRRFCLQAENAPVRRASERQRR